MLRKMLLSKIHRAVVTQCEAVWVLDIDNAARFETYIIRGEPGSGIIGINGAAAKLVEPGHKVIILNYGLATEPLDDHTATVVIADEHNGIEQVMHYPSNLDEPALV